MISRENPIERDVCIRTRRCATCGKQMRPRTSCIKIIICSYCVDCFTKHAVNALGPDPFKNEVAANIMFDKI